MLSPKRQKIYADCSGGRSGRSSRLQGLHLTRDHRPVCDLFGEGYEREDSTTRFTKADKPNSGYHLDASFTG